VREKKIAVVGVGNILMGDEGVGVEVMRALEKKLKGAGRGSSIPAAAANTTGYADVAGAAGVAEFIDAGTGFFTMVSDLEGYETVVIIDAANGDGEPGAMYRFALDENGEDLSERGIPGGIAAVRGGRTGVAELRSAPPMSLHDFGVLESLAWERVRGKLKGKVVLFGIEPLKVELRMGLSELLETKLDQFAERVLREIEDILKQSGYKSPDRGGA
jgi:hydrogenase maturation protease